MTAPVKSGPSVPAAAGTGVADIDWSKADRTLRQSVPLQDDQTAARTRVTLEQMEERRKRETEQSQPSFQWLSGPELYDYQADELEQVAGPWLVRGCITGLSGPPKVGKSQLTLACSGAVARGEPFLGYDTERGPVLYLTEEGPATFRFGAERHGLLNCADFHILSHRLTHANWPDLMDELVARTSDWLPRLVVVDTLPDWASCGGDEENQAGIQNSLMAPLLALAASDPRPSVLLLFHDRKSGGDVIGAIRGSSAMPAKLDMVLSLRETSGGNNRRELRAKGRWDAPDSVTVEWDGERYTLLGSGSAPMVGSIKDVLLDVLPAGRDRAVRFEKDLLPLMRERGFTQRSTIQRAADQLAAEGIVRQEKRKDGRSQPKYIWLVEDEEEMRLSISA